MRGWLWTFSFRSFLNWGPTALRMLLWAPEGCPSLSARVTSVNPRTRQLVRDFIGLMPNNHFCKGIWTFHACSSKDFTVNSSYKQNNFSKSFCGFKCCLDIGRFVALRVCDCFCSIRFCMNCRILSQIGVRIWIGSRDRQGFRHSRNYRRRRTYLGSD